MFHKTRLTGLLLPFLLEEKLNVATGLGLAAALWVALTTLNDLFSRLRQNLRLSLSYAGMIMAHLGVAFFIAGVTVTMTYSVEKDLRVVPGSSYDIAGYEFRFMGTRKVKGENYLADEAVIELWSVNCILYREVSSTVFFEWQSTQRFTALSLVCTL